MSYEPVARKGNSVGPRSDPPGTEPRSERVVGSNRLREIMLWVGVSTKISWEGLNIAGMCDGVGPGVLEERGKG